MTPKEESIRLLNDLRELRRRPGWVHTNDRKILHKLEDLYWELTIEEQSEMENLSWMSWPDLYDEEMS